MGTERFRYDARPTVAWAALVLFALALGVAGLILLRNERGLPFTENGVVVPSANGYGVASAALVISLAGLGVGLRNLLKPSSLEIGPVGIPGHGGPRHTPLPWSRITKGDVRPDLVVLGYAGGEASLLAGLFDDRRSYEPAGRAIADRMRADRGEPATVPAKVNPP